jgi:hypothetical protein
MRTRDPARLADLPSIFAYRRDGASLYPRTEEDLSTLATDYQAMVDARLPHAENTPTFSEPMNSCSEIADQINAATEPL